MALQSNDRNRRPVPPRGTAPVRKQMAPRYAGNRAPQSALSITGIRKGVLGSLFIKIVMGGLIVIFALGLAVSGITSNPFANRGGAAVEGNPAAGPDPVAQVGSQSISRAEFQNTVAQQIQQYSQFGQTTGIVELMGLRQRAMQQLTDNRAQVQAALDRGLTASDAEIDAKIESLIDDQLKSSPGVDTRRQIEAQYGSMEKFKEEARKGFSREGVGRVIETDKLEKAIKAGSKVTEDDYKRSVTKLKLRVIKISPAPLPATGKPSGTPEEQQAKAADLAAQKAKALASALQRTPGLAAFIQAVQKNSEDQESKKKGGDLGWKMPSELNTYGTAVRDALTKSNAALVGPVQGDYTKDQYLFYVEGRKLQLPADYAKKKKEDLKNYETERANEVWTKYQDDLKKQAKPEIYDPSLLAYSIQNEKIFSAPAAEQPKLRQDAVDKYTEALNYANPMEAGAIHYQLAQLYRQMNQPKKVISELRTATAGVTRGEDAARIELARALREQQQPKEAMEILQAISKELNTKPASKTPAMFGNPDDSTRYQLAFEYEALKRKDLAQAERKKVKPPPSQPGSPLAGNIKIGR